MGRWSHLEEKGLPEKPREQGTERAARLWKEVDRLKTLPLADVARALLEGKAKKKRAAELEKEANFDIEAADIALHKLLKAQGLTSVVLEGHRYTPSPEPYPQIKDKHAFLEWAREHMPNNLNMPHSTLETIVKSALDGEGELPPGVDVFFSSSISATKSTKGS